MHLFYTPDIETDIYVLSEEESKHAVRVLRLTESDSVQLTDGKGNWFEAQIMDAHPKRCSLQIQSKIVEYGKRSFYTHIAVAPTKNIERIEWFLEKAVEIGLDELSLLYCDFSERRNVKIERLEKIAAAAMKQSMQAYMPVINEPCKFSDFMKKSLPANRFIAHCYQTERIGLKTSIQPKTENLILIGPEGDFSENEIQMALNNSFKPVIMGNTRLRTETAALVACHTVALMNEQKSLT